MDLETDPFVFGVAPIPFACGLYDGFNFYKWWSDGNGSCLEKAKLYLQGVPAADRGIIYMHNGGRFDFFHMLDWFDDKVFIINSRIIRAQMPALYTRTGKLRAKSGQDAYKWEFRDSYAIMPFPLAAYKKDEIEIDKLSRARRFQYVDEINAYLKTDCVSLWELCMEFHREFGDYLTIASAAFAQLTMRHKFDTLNPEEDEEMRSQFYYGGRVQCFEKGIIRRPCVIYDVNSMYPSVMQDYWHPTSWAVTQDDVIHWPKNNSDKVLRTFFVVAEGKNYGAFPKRMQDGSISFLDSDGIFSVSIHEWLAAIEMGLFKPRKILATYNYTSYSKLHTFVDDFYRARKTAKANGDAIRTLFYKFILNSAYGKFAINPENFSNWAITKTNDPPDGEGWELDTFQEGTYYVWRQEKMTKQFWGYKNVGTGSSITGAARSVLLRAIAKSRGVIYCDTDSIICTDFGGGVVDDTRLGAWKQEAEGAWCAIAGKKMYAVFDSQGNCIKHACKGVDLSPEEIVRVCEGENVFSYRAAPTYQRDGSAKFITRTARMT